MYKFAQPEPVGAGRVQRAKPSTIALVGGFHPPTTNSCTCTMGSHAMAVVGDELRVRGLDGLIDAGDHLDQHQTPDGHDRREERGDHRGCGAKTGGVATAGELTRSSGTGPTALSYNSLIALDPAPTQF